jgi:hypothetical protein
VSAPNEVWLLECRRRARKDGKWSEWEQVEGWRGRAVVFLEFPTEEIVAYPIFERRAVKYVREEPK